MKELLHVFHTLLQFTMRTKYVNYGEDPHPVFPPSDIPICISGATGEH